MSKSEGLQKLQEIGAQKIHEQTHIPAGHVQAILHGSYDGLNKVQFIGFISILEREYGVDLQSLKLKGIAHFDDLKNDEEEGVFVVAKNNTKNKLIYLGVALGIFVLGIFFYLSGDSNEGIEIPKEDVAVARDVTKTLANAENEEKNIVTPLAKEQTADKRSITQQEDTAQQEDAKEQAATAEQKSTTAEATIPDILEISTKGKVWLGYIELESNKKRQKVIHELSLDAHKNWLFTTGHGYITFKIGEKEYKFRKKHKLKLLYKDGELKELTTEEFKRYNRGSIW